MRVLMVTNTYAPARNGVAMWVALSVRELRAQGHEVDVLTYAHDRREPDQPGMHEVPAWAGLDRDFRVAPILSGLPDSLAGRRYDIVHVHHPILLGPAGIELGRSIGAKVAFTCHSVYTDYLREYYWGAGRFLTGWLDGLVARFVDSCDVVFAPSDRLEEWLADIGTTTPVARIQAPADTTRIRPMPRDEARSGLGLDGRPVALYVGRIADEKRVADLVREFATTLRAVPDALLVLAGSGRRDAAVARQVERAGLQESVRMLGAVDAEELRRWYAAADACTSASRSEVGPLTVVEAMAFGCPTVAHRAPGFTDRVVNGVNGLLVGYGDGELGQALARVLGDARLRAELSAGALAAAPTYTPQAVTNGMVQVYRRLLAAGAEDAAPVAPAGIVAAPTTAQE